MRNKISLGELFLIVMTACTIKLEEVTDKIKMKGGNRL